MLRQPLEPTRGAGRHAYPPREDAKLFLGKTIPLQVYDAEFGDFKFLRATETSLKAMKAELR